MLEHFIAAVAAHLAVDSAKEALARAFAYVAKKRPDLAGAAAKADASGDAEAIERIFREAVGVIRAAAGTGELAINSSVVTALNGIRFDHQRGRVSIGNAVISSKVLVTGGSRGATGETVIHGNTALRSQGTAIQVGRGGAIVMTGNASIKQT